MILVVSRNKVFDFAFAQCGIAIEYGSAGGVRTGIFSLPKSDPQELADGKTSRSPQNSGNMFNR
jgi:predicted RecA/RadA family phage recombinase